MSTQTEITRLQTARNKLRTWLVGLGLATSTDKLDALADKAAAIKNNGAVDAQVKEGESYTIPAGYHNGSGKVTAKTLESQTGVDDGKTAVTAAQMLTGYQGWVNGTKITGTMANNGQISATITGLGSVTGDTQYTIPAGYTTGGTVSLTNDIETALAAI